jgi:hypothetical protein
MGIASALNAPIIRSGLRWVGPAAGFAIGLALPLVTRWELAGFSRAAQSGVLVVAGAGVIVGRWLLPSAGALRVGLVLVAAALVWGWVWPS